MCCARAEGYLLETEYHGLGCCGFLKQFAPSLPVQVWSSHMQCEEVHWALGGLDWSLYREMALGGGVRMNRQSLGSTNLVGTAGGAGAACHCRAEFDGHTDPSVERERLVPLAWAGLQ